MAFSVHDNICSIEKPISETFPYNDLVVAFKSLMEKGFHSVVLEMEKCTQGNSIGMLKWSRSIMSVPLNYHYRHVPVWLVHQLNNVHDLLSRTGVTVESFYAPFYNEENDELILMLLSPGKDFPLLTDYSDYNFQPIQRDQLWFQPDFEAPIYLEFVASLHKLGRFPSGA